MEPTAYDLYTRRRFLRTLGLLAGSVVGGKVLAHELFAGNPEALNDPRLLNAYLDELTLTPHMTEGPFYPYNDLPLDLDNDLVRIGEGTAAEGEVLHVAGQVLTQNGEPVKGATVHMWQADTHGAYIHRGTANPDKRDRAFQGIGKFETDSEGRYKFRTVRPGLYPGRTAHLHFKIERKGVAAFTTQLCDKDHPRTANDGELRRIRDAKAREAVQSSFKPIAESKAGELAASFNIILSDATRDLHHD